MGGGEGAAGLNISCARVPRGTFGLRKNCPISTTNSTWTATWLSPGLRDGSRHGIIYVKCHECTVLMRYSAATWFLGILLRAPFFLLRLSSYVYGFPAKQPAAPPAEFGLRTKLKAGVFVYMRGGSFSPGNLQQAVPCTRYYLFLKYLRYCIMARKCTYLQYSFGFCHIRKCAADYVFPNINKIMSVLTN
jgi:hypothetical protein